MPQEPSYLAPANNRTLERLGPAATQLLAQYCEEVLGIDVDFRPAAIHRSTVAYLTSRRYPNVVFTAWDGNRWQQAIAARADLDAWMNARRRDWDAPLHRHR